MVQRLPAVLEPLSLLRPKMRRHFWAKQAMAEITRLSPRYFCWFRRGRVNPNRNRLTQSTESTESRRLRTSLQYRLNKYQQLIYRFIRILGRRYARSMKKFRLPTIALVVAGTVNLLAFVYIAGHREYAPASYSQGSLSGCNIPAQVPAWIGYMP